ncbi:ComEC/Rec2 family competence protein [Roseibium aestuarii]|uniref:ComEC/Rec2 family competence protein n=1 Tax=Roseibium aestuarii TaxID=2600299 RepID=A0ABW4JSU6_9HYPH|nr:ComEC/Rec2 family competence protein [Roseibium aestuarii]
MPPLGDPNQTTLLCALVFCAGIGLYFQLPEEPEPWALALLWLGLALACCWQGVRALLVPRRGQPTPFLFPASRLTSRLLLISLLLVSGVACGAWRSLQVAGPRLDAPRVVRVLAHVESTEPRERGLRLVLKILALQDRQGRPQTDQGGRTDLLGMRVRVNVRAPKATSRDAGLPSPPEGPRSGLQASGPQPGDRIEARLRLVPGGGPAAPGAYDFAFWSYFAGLGASGQVLGPISFVEMPQASDDTGWRGRASRGLEALRADLARRLLASAGGGPEAGLAVALLVGDRSGVGEAAEEDLRQAGLAHILAISGLHMAIFAGAGYAAVGLVLALLPGFSLSAPTHKIAAVAGLALATLYLVISGAAVPTQRSFLMVALVFLARLTDRRGLTLHSVALAGILLLVPAPERLLSPGFQMSFGAVLCLVAVYEGWRRAGGREGGRRRRARPATRSRSLRLAGAVGRYGLGLLVTSLVAGTITGVIGAHHFGRIAPFGLLGNLLAMPLFALIIMPLGGLALLLLPLGLASLPLQGMTLALGWLLEIAHAVARFGTGDGSGIGGAVGAVAGAVAGAVPPPGVTASLLLGGGLICLTLAWAARGTSPRAGLGGGARLAGDPDREPVPFARQQGGQGDAWDAGVPSGRAQGPFVRMRQAGQGAARGLRDMSRRAAPGLIGAAGPLAAIGLGLVLWGQERPPDLQVSADGRHVAFRTRTGDLVTTARARSLQAEVWFTTEGETGGHRGVTSLLRSCDAGGCVMRGYGTEGAGAHDSREHGASGRSTDPSGPSDPQEGAAAAPEPRRREGSAYGVLPGSLRIALPKTGAALREDCLLADVIVTALIAPPDCAASLVLDQRRLATGGAVSVWLTPHPDAPRVEKGDHLTGSSSGSGSEREVPRGLETPGLATPERLSEPEAKSGAAGPPSGLVLHVRSAIPSLRRPWMPRLEADAEAMGSAAAGSR